VVGGPFPAAPIAPAALYGTQNPADVAAHLADLEIHRFKLGIMLFHPREHLSNLLPVLVQLAPVLCDLIHLPEDDLTQIPDEGGDSADLATEVLNTRPHLGKLDCHSIHVILQDPSQSL
jgi:hypothetical protein